MPTIPGSVVDELAALRAEIERLTGCLSRANAASEKFEREWYLRGDEIERLQVQAETIASLERGVYDKLNPGEIDVQPNWVYEARTAIKHQNENLPWLPDLLAALEWDGGTVHQAINAVRRLVAADKEREPDKPMTLQNAINKARGGPPPIPFQGFA